MQLPDGGQMARADERAILGQIRAALEIDLQEFEQLAKFHTVQEQSVIKLVEHMESDEPYRRDMNPWLRKSTSDGAT